MQTQVAPLSFTNPKIVESQDFPSVEAFPGMRIKESERLLPMNEIAPDVRRLSEVVESKALASIARQWMVIGGVFVGFMAISTHLGWGWWMAIYLAAAFIIATRQHALFGLIHEATHYRLSKNRSRNDFLSDFFCAFPLGLCTDVYRRRHLLHHQHTNTEQDPDWQGMHLDEDWHWPKDHISTLRLFTLDFLGLSAHKLLIILFLWSPLQAAVSKHVRLTTAERIRLAGFCLLLAGGLTIGHAWLYFLLLWVIPQLTIFGALIRLRSVAEHLVCPSLNELNETRHVEATWFERLTLAPFNVNYHLAHHLFPSVPWYNLPELQGRLMQFEIFRQQAKITKSYLGIREGVLGEMLGASARGAR